MNLPTHNDFERLVLDDVPLIDVRAPVEFADGAFPTAVNLPLMDDEERRLVGIRHKRNGPDAALALGRELVCGAIKAERIEAWTKRLEARPESLIYCFRGGERSRIAQRWIREATGRVVPRLDGGYKAFRRYLIERFEPRNVSARPIVLGGRTGIGKTRLLRKLENAVDLEAIANHRGSAFGRRSSPQPRPIDFENALAWALVKHRARGWRTMPVEDEGRHVGLCFLPQPLVERFAGADVVVLERPLEERVEITFEEYVRDDRKEYAERFGAAGETRWREAMEASIDRIRKRLGGARHQELRRRFALACENRDPTRHKEWIRFLLLDYYDPMYDYQLQNKTSRIVFRGDEPAVLDWLRQAERA